MKNSLATASQKGFTLVEALVATLVISIGFAGCYTLVGYVQESTQSAIVRQKLQMQANQILDLIEADSTNISQYNNMNLKVCTVPNGGETVTSVLRKYEWCQRLTAEAHAPQTNDVRMITVTQPTVAVCPAPCSTYYVQVLLESDNKEIQIVMKRQYVL